MKKHQDAQSANFKTEVISKSSDNIIVERIILSDSAMLRLTADIARIEPLTSEKTTEKLDQPASATKKL